MEINEELLSFICSVRNRTVEQLDAFIDNVMSLRYKVQRLNIINVSFNVTSECIKSDRGIGKFSDVLSLHRRHSNKTDDLG